MKNEVSISRQQKIAFIYNSLNDVEQKKTKSLGLDLLSDDKVDEAYYSCVASSKHYRAVLNEMKKDEIGMESFIANLADEKINRIISSIIYIHKLTLKKRRSHGIAIIGILAMLNAVYFNIIPLFYYGLLLMIVYVIILLDVMLKISKITDDHDVVRVFLSYKDDGFDY